MREKWRERETETKREREKNRSGQRERNTEADKEREREHSSREMTTHQYKINPNTLVKKQLSHFLWSLTI